MSNYNALRNQIKTGDLIAFKGKGWVSRIICWKQRYPVSHVGVVCNIDSMGRVMVMESTSLDGQKGVQLNRLSRRVQQYNGDVSWFPLNERSRLLLDVNAFHEYLWAQDGKPYDWKQAMKAGMWSLTTRENAKELFCSELVGGAWKAGGLIHNVNTSELTPEDLCRMHWLYRKAFIRLN